MMKIDYSSSCWIESTSIDVKDFVFYLSSYFSSNEEGFSFQQQCVEDFNENKQKILEIFTYIVDQLPINEKDDALRRIDVDDSSLITDKLKEISYEEFTRIINEIICSTNMLKSDLEEDDCDQCGSFNLSFTIKMEDM